MMSNLVAHAEHELGRIRGEPGDDMQAAMNAHLLAMVRLFADEGHSGFSASYAVSALERLLRFHPLTPLTGEPDEWTEVWDGCWQNRRCGHVFKDESGAYDSQGIIFRDPDGIPDRLDRPRIEALGNAVMPAVVAAIGRAFGRAFGTLPTPGGSDGR